MAKLVGNQGGSTSYPTTKSPSTHDRDAVEGGFTSSFPKDRVTHSHMTPKGEDDHEGQRQYRARGNVAANRGPALARATPRQGPYGDRAETFGKIGSGVPGGSRNPYAGNGLRNESRESFTTDEDESYRRRHGLK